MPTNTPTTTNLIKHHIQICQELLKALQGESNTNASPTSILNQADKSWRDTKTMVRIVSRFNQHQTYGTSTGGPRVQSPIVEELENLRERIQEASPSERKEVEKTLQKMAQSA